MSAENSGQQELRTAVDKYLLQLRPYLHSEGCDALLEDLQGERLALRMVLPPSNCASQVLLLVRALQYRLMEQFPNLSSVDVVKVERRQPTE